MKKLTKKNIRHYSRRYAKSKAGTTLVELIAVIAILAITSSSCLSAMFAMVDVSKRGQQISESQRICALLGEQFLLYGNTASYVDSYATLPTLKAYNETSEPNGFMDAQNTSGSYGDKCDYFIQASKTQNSTIEFSRFDTTLPGGHGLKTITSIDGVKQIDFTVSPLYYYDNPSNATHTKTKYVLRYTILTIYDYEITGGVVLNNTVEGDAISPFSYVSIVTDPDVTDGTEPYGLKTTVRIRSTNRKLVDRD